MLYADLTVDIASMGYGEDADALLSIIHAVNHTVVAYADAVIRRISQFLAAVGTWVGFKGKDLFTKPFAQNQVQIVKLFFCALYDGNAIDQARCLRSAVPRNVRKLRALSFERAPAMVKSMRSSRKRWSWTMAERTSFWSRRGSAWNAVRKMWATACASVITIPPCSFYQEIYRGARYVLLWKRVGHGRTGPRALPRGTATAVAARGSKPRAAGEPVAEGGGSSLDGTNAALLFDRAHLETLCRVPGAALPGAPAQVIDRVIEVRRLNSEGYPQER
jgi:hypothetical protein